MPLAKAILARQSKLGIPTVSKLAKHIGVSRSSLYNTLQGVHGLNAPTLRKYAKFLKVTPAALTLLAPRKTHRRSRR